MAKKPESEYRHADPVVRDYKKIMPGVPDPDPDGETYLTNEQLIRVDKWEAQALDAKAKGQTERYEVIMGAWRGAEFSTNTTSKTSYAGVAATPFGSVTVTAGVLPVGKRKPGADVKKAIRLLGMDKSVDDIAAAVGKTADAVRRIKADLKAGEFDLSE